MAGPTRRKGMKRVTLTTKIGTGPTTHKTAEQGTTGSLGARASQNDKKNFPNRTPPSMTRSTVTADRKREVAKNKTKTAARAQGKATRSHK